MTDTPEKPTRRAGPGWRARTPAKGNTRAAKTRREKRIDAGQLELLPVVEFVPRGLSALLSADEAMHRDNVMAAGGKLRRAMELIERSDIGDAWVAECWRWATSMQIVQGHNPRTTVARYVDTLRRFATWLLPQNLDYRTLQSRQIEEWVKALNLQLRNALSWRKTQIAALKSFYDWRHRAGLGENCAAGVRSPKRGHRVARKYTAQQLQALFAAVKLGSEIVRDRDRVLLMFLLATGGRCEEVAQLRLDQVELGEKTGVVRFLGKGSKERSVGIEGPIVRELLAWVMVRDQIPGLGDTVFWSTHPTHWGMPLSSSGVERMVCRYARAAGLGSWGVHRFRVTYATWLYDDGVDIERIRILLGHETIETTRRYLAVSEKQASTRMTAARQYHAIGEDPPGTPRWLKAKQNQQKAPNESVPF